MKGHSVNNFVCNIKNNILPEDTHVNTKSNLILFNKIKKNWNK